MEFRRGENSRLEDMLGGEGKGEKRERSGGREGVLRSGR